MMKKLSLVFLVVVFLSSCYRNETNKKELVYAPTPYKIDVPYGFPTKLNVPENNPMTVEGVELGRYLFYDGRLSGRTHPDSLMSCGTCHIQANSFECGIDHPLYKDGRPHGLTGKETHHVMLPLINLVFNDNAYLWNGRVSEDGDDMRFQNIEDLVWMSVLAEHEMAGDTTRTKELFNSIPEYRELFYKAFGTEEVTFDLISKAIAQFIRTMVSGDSKFDKYLRGDAQLTSDERAGFVLFTTEEGADCFHCHGGGGNPLFTTNLFYNNGKQVHPDPQENDRYNITGDEMDKGAFKPTTLRNIEVTGPYMHDGRFKTLDEVIDFYSHRVLYSDYIDPLMHHVDEDGVQLTPKEKNQLKAFLKTLRDDTFLTNPDLSDPKVMPDGFVELKIKN